MTTNEETTEPVVRVHGDATPEEVAAVVTVLSALSRSEEPRPRRGPTGWASRAAALRAPVLPGPNGWRSSLRS
jgi:hypothetical protein